MCAAEHEPRRDVAVRETLQNEPRSSRAPGSEEPIARRGPPGHRRGSQAPQHLPRARAASAAARLVEAPQRQRRHAHGRVLATQQASTRAIRPGPRQLDDAPLAANSSTASSISRAPVLVAGGRRNEPFRDAHRGAKRTRPYGFAIDEAPRDAKRPPRPRLSRAAPSPSPPAGPPSGSCSAADAAKHRLGVDGRRRCRGRGRAGRHQGASACRGSVKELLGLGSAPRRRRRSASRTIADRSRTAAGRRASPRRASVRPRASGPAGQHGSVVRPAGESDEVGSHPAAERLDVAAPLRGALVVAHPLARIEQEAKVHPAATISSTRPPAPRRWLRRGSACRPRLAFVDQRQALDRERNISTETTASRRPSRAPDRERPSP